jgi:hypothetical protein
MGQKITKVNRDAFFSTLQSKLLNANSILDVGCGIKPQSFSNPFIRIHVDAHQQYLDIVKQANNNKIGLYNWNKFYINRTTYEIIKHFPAKMVDSIFLIDVIEHLDKAHGKDLLRKFGEIARNQVIIFTPLGFVEQHHDDGKDAWGLDGGKWQEHKSGWTPEDFDDTWEMIVCEDFHELDNMGQARPEPVGAFFAIKNVGGPVQPIPSKLGKIGLIFKYRSIVNKLMQTLKSN